MSKHLCLKLFFVLMLCIGLLCMLSGCAGNGSTEGFSASIGESESESESESASESETEPDLTTPTAGLKIETGLFFCGLFRQDPVITGFETAEDVS